MWKKPIRVMLIVMSVVVILVVGSIVGYKVYVNKAVAATRPPTAEQLAQRQLELDKLTTNLLGSAIIQVTLVLQTDSTDAKADLQLRKAQVLDAVNGILHVASKDQLATPSGQEDVKKVIEQRVNAMMSTGKVTNVYIENIIVQ